MNQKKLKKNEDEAPIPKIIQQGLEHSMNPETRRIVSMLVFFLVGIISLLGVFNAGGIVGEALKNAFKYVFGFLYFIIPFFFLYFGMRLIKRKTLLPGARIFWGGALFVITLLGLETLSIFTRQGGLIGEVTVSLFSKLFGVIGAITTLAIGLIISFMILLNTRPDFTLLLEKLKSFFTKLLKGGLSFGKSSIHQLSLPKEDDYSDEGLEIHESIETPTQMNDVKTKKIVAHSDTEEEDVPAPKAKKRDSGTYVFPPTALLSRDQGKPNTGDIKANANIIKRTLQNFGIEVEMDEITVGPTVTRYALKPAEGVKLSRIVALQSDLALALAAHPIRIEAPIPGKSLVGIEIPNKAKSIIGFSNLMEDPLFKNDPKPLLVALGKNISGKARFANLAKMPHALIAGATGSGKSVTVHAIITSLLYRNSSDDLKFIFVDPKRVELTMYNGLPHLLTPVITDPKKTIMALKWAAKEMEKRYDILEKSKVRDIASYHENIYNKRKNDEIDRMPYIVIIIDELADIMSAYPRELESGIVRLAQMSRAVGIHLILSTQRPSVNVITGLIKANVPARVALQVASQIDSRTIIDQPGAEKLLGAGDMLYSSGEMSSPERIQCAYITENEVKNIVSFIKDNNDILSEDINLSPGALGNTDGVFSANVDGNDDDDLYEDARATVMETGKASTSFLQRKLGVGYARAARLIDMMEERGVVGPGNGSKPREVLQKSVAEEKEEFEN